MVKGAAAPIRVPEHSRCERQIRPRRRSTQSGRGEDVAERLVQRVLGFPPRCGADLRGVADEARDVDRTHQGRVLDEAELSRRVREELGGHVGDGHAAPGTDVVDLAGLAVLGEEPVARARCRARR